MAGGLCQPGLSGEEPPCYSGVTESPAGDVQQPSSTIPSQSLSRPSQETSVTSYCAENAAYTDAKNRRSRSRRRTGPEALPTQRTRRPGARRAAAAFPDPRCPLDRYSRRPRCCTLRAGPDSHRSSSHRNRGCSRPGSLDRTEMAHPRPARRRKGRRRCRGTRSLGQAQVDSHSNPSAKSSTGGPCPPPGSARSRRSVTPRPEVRIVIASRVARIRRDHVRNCRLPQARAPVRRTGRRYRSPAATSGRRCRPGRGGGCRGLRRRRRRPRRCWSRGRRCARSCGR